MARLARVVAEGMPHHVTQRGNAWQFLLNADADRMVYLDLLRQAVQLFQIEIRQELNIRLFCSSHDLRILLPMLLKALPMLASLTTD